MNELTKRRLQEENTTSFCCTVFAELEELQEERLSIVSHTEKAKVIEEKNWYLINMEWWEKWKKYVDNDKIQNHQSVKSKLHEVKRMKVVQSGHPGAIDNNTLIDKRKNDLKPDLVENVHYCLLPTNSWIILLTRYGGGPEIQRNMVESSVSKLKYVEIYPLNLRVVDRTTRLQLFPLRASKTININQLRNIISNKLNKESKKIRLLVKSDKTSTRETVKYKILKNLEMTLEELHLKDGDKVFVSDEKVNKPVQHYSASSVGSSLSKVVSNQSDPQPAPISVPQPQTAKNPRSSPSRTRLTTSCTSEIEVPMSSRTSSSSEQIQIVSPFGEKISAAERIIMAHREQIEKFADKMVAEMLTALKELEIESESSIGQNLAKERELVALKVKFVKMEEHLNVSTKTIKESMNCQIIELKGRLEAAQGQLQIEAQHLESLTSQLQQKESRMRELEAREKALSGQNLDNLSMDALMQLVKEQEKAMMMVRRELERRIEDERMCYYCMENANNTALCPCGHTLCHICAGKVSVCPKCRQDIENTLRLYH
jgi:hypothetical protein